MLLAKRLLITTLLINKAKCVPDRSGSATVASTFPHVRLFQASSLSSPETSDNVVAMPKVFPYPLRRIRARSNHHEVRVFNWEAYEVEEEATSVFPLSSAIKQHDSASTATTHRHRRTREMNVVGWDKKQYGAKIKNWLFAGACAPRCPDSR